jgi:hypothetical protein
MTLQQQWQTIKENWILIVLVLVLVLFMSFGGMQSMDSLSSGSSKNMYAYDMQESARSPSYYGNDGDFAPEIEERKLTKTASMTSKIERGAFDDAATSLKNIVTATDSYILQENVQINGKGEKVYKYGSYTLKVDTAKYESIVAELKTIGEVTAFNENTQDITGQYNNAEINLGVEKTRLARYEQMYAEATKIEDKINLNDRIFDQERTIKYLEDKIKNLDNKVDYTTISVSLQEEQPNYYDVAFVKFSTLVRNLVSSLNALLHFMFIVLPWAIVLGIGLFIWNMITKKKKK